MTRRIPGWALAAVLAVALPAAAQQKAPSRHAGSAWQEGRITSVVDGDSLWFQPLGSSKAPIELRLRQIDAPEICQAWGRQAREALAGQVNGKLVTMRAAGRDSHGRTLGDLQVEGQDIGRWLVVEGHAWSTRTKWDRGPLVKEERIAHSLRRGLHSEPGAVEPRHFRTTNGPCPR